MIKTLLIVVCICLQAMVVQAEGTLDLAWDWSPGDSGYTSGPNGDIVYAIYMRTQGDSDYAYDYPVLSDIDNCWWETDQYTCETTLAFPFDPETTYYLVAVAYVADSPTQRSLSSNEITYVSGDAEKGPNDGNHTAGSGSGGGGCFVHGLLTPVDGSR